MADIDVVEACGCCHFCRDQLIDSLDQTGSCYLLPPTVGVDPDTGIPATLPLPLVELDSWCGQFKRAKETYQ